MNEQWKTIPSLYQYEASSLGRIRRRAIGRYYRNVGPIKTQKENSNGYLRVAIEIKGKVKQFLVNRLVCETFHGYAPSEKYTAAHRDGNRKNNKSENLSWLTRKENYQDQILHGTSKRGSGNSMAKLTEQEVLDIRARRDLGIKVLALVFGVTESCIRSILAKRIWRYL